MKKQSFSILTALSFLLLSSMAFSQKPVFQGLPIKAGSYPELSAQFYNFETYELDMESLDRFIKSSSQELEFTLQWGDDYRWDIELVPADMRAPNYTVRVMTNTGIEEMPRSDENIAFRGRLRGEAGGGSVALTVAADFLYGFVRDGDEMFFIEPLWHFVPGRPKNHFVLYSSRDVKPTGGRCGMNELEQHTPKGGADSPHDGSKSTGSCYTVELAIASDLSMYTKYGSVGAVISHSIAVMNNVQTNYDNEFSTDLQFSIVQEFVVATSDPWTSSTNSLALLISFKDWGPAGFSATHDLGQLWTNRDLDEDIVGKAYTGGICGSLRYHILSDYTSNADKLRVMTAHEIGHNFGAEHDTDGNSHIMAEVVSTSTTWSSASVTVINAMIPLLGMDPPFGCLSDCSCPTSISITAPLSSGFFDYEASDYITASNDIIDLGITYVTYDAANYVLLNPGFFAETYVVFQAFIDGCGGLFQGEPGSDDREQDGENTVHPPVASTGVSDGFVMRPNPASDRLTITHDFSGEVGLGVFDLAGKQLFFNQYPVGEAIELDVSGFSSGIYFVKMSSSGNMLTKQLVVSK